MADVVTLSFAKAVNPKNLLAIFMQPNWWEDTGSVLKILRGAEYNTDINPGGVMPLAFHALGRWDKWKEIFSALSLQAQLKLIEQDGAKDEFSGGIQEELLALEREMALWVWEQHPEVRECASRKVLIYSDELHIGEDRAETYNARKFLVHLFALDKIDVVCTGEEILVNPRGAMKKYLPYGWDTSTPFAVLPIEEVPTFVRRELGHRNILMLYRERANENPEYDITLYGDRAADITVVDSAMGCIESSVFRDSIKDKSAELCVNYKGSKHAKNKRCIEMSVGYSMRRQGKLWSARREVHKASQGGEDSVKKEKENPILKPFYDAVAKVGVVSEFSYWRNDFGCNMPLKGSHISKFETLEYSVREKSDE